MADRKPGEPPEDAAPEDAAPEDAAPEDAVADRGAQDHDYAYEQTGGEPEPGLYPADSVPDRQGDVTPDAYPSPKVDWDDRVQPERPDEQDL